MHDIAYNVGFILRIFLILLFDKLNIVDFDTINNQ